MWNIHSLMVGQIFEHSQSNNNNRNTLYKQRKSKASELGSFFLIFTALIHVYLSHLWVLVISLVSQCYHPSSSNELFRSSNFPFLWAPRLSYMHLIEQLTCTYHDARDSKKNWKRSLPSRNSYSRHSSKNGGCVFGEEGVWTLPERRNVDGQNLVHWLVLQRNWGLHYPNYWLN